VRQYAQGVFLQREIFKTAERVGILMLVARFERRVVILPDTGITRHITSRELDGVIAAMAAADISGVEKRRMYPSVISWSSARWQ